MSESEKQQISFYLRKDLVKELDETATKMRMTRSQFVEWLLTESLPRARKLVPLMKDIFKVASNEGG